MAWISLTSALLLFIESEMPCHLTILTSLSWPSQCRLIHLAIPTRLSWPSQCRIIHLTILRSLSWPSQCRLIFFAILRILSMAQSVSSGSSHHPQESLHGPISVVWFISPSSGVSPWPSQFRLIHFAIPRSLSMAQISRSSGVSPGPVSIVWFISPSSGVSNGPVSVV